MAASSLNFDFLSRAYFYWDKPVEYVIDGNVLNIYPVKYKDSELFLASASVITFDKDSIPDVEVIQMSYLEFVVKYLFQHDETAKARLVNIFSLCLHMDDVCLYVDNFGKPYLSDSKQSVIITPKKFNDIRRIIMYQNIPDYDDEYINPELKADMAETDAVRGMGLKPLTAEEKMAKVTVHSGIDKSVQMEWTMRYHAIIFRDVCGESEFNVTYPIALYTGKANKVPHWIFRKKTGRFDGYITSRGEFAKSMGADESQIISSIDHGETGQLSAMYENFNK